jgi:peroxiredoxin
MKQFAAVTALLALLVAALPFAAQSQEQSQQAAIATTKLKVGDTAPDFTLPSNQKSAVTLSSFRGKKNVILAFYILAFTPG